MKKIFYIIVLLLLIGCKTNNEKKLENNRTVTTIFDKSEIEDLRKILTFFNEQICDNENIIECYQRFLKRVAEQEKEYIIEINIPFQEQLKMYNQINENTFNQIWVFYEMRHRDYPDVLKYLNFNINGKYLKFLKEFGKENIIIENYLDRYRQLGGISMPYSSITKYLEDYDEQGIRRVKDIYEDYDVEDERIQLVIAIHYLTLNDNFERIEKY